MEAYCQNGKRAKKMIFPFFFLPFSLIYFTFFGIVSLFSGADAPILHVTVTLLSFLQLFVVCEGVVSCNDDT